MLARFLARVLLGSSAQRQFAQSDLLDVWQLAMLPLVPDFVPELALIQDFAGITSLSFRISHCALRFALCAFALSYLKSGKS